MTLHAAPTSPTTPTTTGHPSPRTSPSATEAATAPDIDTLVTNAHCALDALRALNQAQVDTVVKAMAAAAADHHLDLAQAAVAETGRGVVEDKATKNLFAAEHVWHSIKDEKTVGEIGRDDAAGLVRLAEPVGVIAALTPVTNPTSTAIFKAIIAIKARNPIIFSFHPAAQHCSRRAAQIVRDAARAAGAPAHCVQWLPRPGLAATTALIDHPGVALCLATGGAGMVKAAYSTGKPALGVGPGNVPVYVAGGDLARAAHDIVMSKTFDNGMICASEQTIVVHRPAVKELRTHLRRLGAHLLERREADQLRAALFPADGSRGPDVVGASAAAVAAAAGLRVPDRTRLLIATIETIGPDEPLSAEKLFPLLALHVVDSEQDALAACRAVLHNGGLGHTAVIHGADDDVVARFADQMPACRILLDQPSAMGGIGGVYGGLTPSLTLGCGALGHNSVSHNVSARDLVQVKLVSARRDKMQWLRLPAQTYFRRHSVELLAGLPDLRRVMIVTDPGMVAAGHVDTVVKHLRARPEPVAVEVFSDVEPNPSTTTVEEGANRMRRFRPDSIIGLGGGSAMDAAKAMWVFYEQPQTSFEAMRGTFLDIRTRIESLPPLGRLARFIAIPTTSGTGAECTPFAVITDARTHVKYPLVDYELTPHVAIVDAQFVDTVPRPVAADSGLDALTHAVESYCSVLASDATRALSVRAGRVLVERLRPAVLERDPAAIEAVHDASAIAGMAFANAFLGIVHSLSHAVGARFGVPHGRANAILLPHVLRYNAGRPERFPLYPNISVAGGAKDLAAFAGELGLPAASTAQGVESLAREVTRLAADLGVPADLASAGVPADEFEAAVPDLAARAFDDQCTGSNPRQPTIDDLCDLLRAAYGSTAPATA